MLKPMTKVPMGIHARTSRVEALREKAGLDKELIRQIVGEKIVSHVDVGSKIRAHDKIHPVNIRDPLAQRLRLL